MVARRPEELFLAISAYSENFTVKILPSVCTGGWIWLFQTARKKEFWEEKKGERGLAE